MNDERRQAKHLDDTLSGKPADETSPLVETADAIKRSLDVDVPPADRTRALFLSAVGAREKRRFSAMRLLVPALGVAVLVYAVMIGQSARPGERLWPLRKALNAVGVGQDPVVEVDDHLNRASAILKDARQALNTNPGKSMRLAITTIQYLGEVRDMLPQLGSERGSRLETVETLEDQAVDVIALASEPEEIDDNAGPGPVDDGSGRGSGDDSDDNSGPGSDDDSSGSGSGGDDSSGSGSDDGSSGSGSGDDSDDSSGSGSSGSGSGDDSSGSGSGDDSSGSGSSGSGSDGSADSSGSGSGSDSD